MVPINYVAMIVAAVSSMVVGALWYSPLLFLNPWMKLIGKTAEECKDQMAGVKPMAIMAVVSLVASYVIAHWVYYANATDLVGGLQAGFWGWLGFNVISIGDYLFAGRPMKLFLINSGQQLVSLLVMGAILAVWR